MCPMIRRPLGMELALLGFLFQGPKHGYQIHQLLMDTSGLGLIWNLKQSQLYALLLKLESDGYLQGVVEYQSVSTRPLRRLFHLTEKGSNAFREWLAQPVPALHFVRQEFMAKYYFAQLDSGFTVSLLVANQRRECKEWIKKFTEQLNQCELRSYGWRMYRYRIGQIESFQNWLNDIV